MERELKGRPMKGWKIADEQNENTVRVGALLIGDNFGIPSRGQREREGGVNTHIGMAEPPLQIWRRLPSIM